MIEQLLKVCECATMCVYLTQYNKKTKEGLLDRVASMHRFVKREFHSQVNFSPVPQIIKWCLNSILFLLMLSSCAQVRG